MTDYTAMKDGIFKSVCSLDCPDQCGLLIHKENGKIVKVQGDPDHPVTQGNICNKVRNVTARLYDEKRLTTPLKRVGHKGDGQFAPITWEEAIETIRQKWTKLIEEKGPESILPYSFYGNMGNLNAEGMDRRFFYRLGSSQLDRTICQSAGTTGYKYTMGASIGTDPEETIHTKLFIFWGINAVSTNMHQITLAQKARKQGAKIVVIDVHKNQTGRMADWFIPLRPGTDSALALGIMHVLFKEGLTDEAFLETYTVGHKELREHVKQYDPETVEGITGVSKEDILTLARMYAETSPSLIRIGNGLQHHDNGGMSIRTISCLPALTGQWLYKGGGAMKSNSSFLSYNETALQRPDLLKERTPRSFNMNQLGSVLTNASPSIDSLFVYSCNPAVVTPEANKVREGLLREDLFTVVHDLFLTETAAYADIVLPATSAFENEDFYTSYWHHYIQIQEPVIERYGESKSNTEVFRLLAHAMGFEDAAFRETDAELMEQALDHPENPHYEDISYEALKEKKWIKAKRGSFQDLKLSTPSGKIELYSEQMKKDGYPALPTYVPLYQESDYPLTFIPGPNHNFLNSTFSLHEKHQKLEKFPKLHMNEQDAKAREIEDGDMVRVLNDRGECELVVSVGQNVLSGVVVSQGLWADQKGKKHLVNGLTPDRLADMGGGATFFSGRVEVEK
ncbi:MULTISPECIES: molybdopterin oxidoreductase family protein [unclassified Bacillus (in: firmicutes)]|uniref:molybdopterin oxidoreductase family protein n=1 Tax=unclassified Bacillus (in: firmicutes) TaxID=185979 RepID=UPI000D031E1A|nr:MULTISPECIES: molybdopterin oxidoreductase family protein [unclassified Bacillus (in: firmicutes)]PRR92740.1 oxidoreductase [Bacillus sp. NMCN1]PRS00374.1 oxidoreductase [Bacillus sp. NMCN6]